MENNSASIQNTEKTNLLFSNKRRLWTQDETELFLKCFLTRQHEFQSRKKIYAYKLVVEDMLAQGFKDKSLTAHNLEAKMKSLYKAYRKYKEGFNRKASNCIAPFLKELQSIFEAETNNLDFSMCEKSTCIKTENVFEDFEMDSQSETEDPLFDIAENELQSSNKTTATVSPKEDSLNMTTDCTKCNSNTSAQLEYYEAKLQCKRRALAMKAKFYGEMTNLFKEKFQREETMEREKLQLLTKIAEKLCKP